MDNNLDYRVFMNQFTYELQQVMNEYCEDESYSVDLIQDKIKVDGEEKDVLTVCYSDSNLGPILYFEDKYFWYQDGHTINDLVNLTMKQLECLKEDVPLDEPFTQKNINEKIYLEPLNFEKHKEYLKDMPYEKVGDIALVARYMIDDANMFNIRYDFCRYVRMSPQEIFEIAHKNTDKDQYVCKKVSDILADILRENGMSDFYISDFITENLSVSLYALSNQAGYMRLLTASYMKRIMELKKKLIGTQKRYKPNRLHMPLVSISILIHLIIHLAILPDGQAVKILKSCGTV